MKKKTNVLGIVLLVLAVLCIGMYFIYGSGNSDHKVIFDSDGGTEVISQTVKNGEKATKPTDPTKENSDFVEWQLNGVAYDFESTVTKDITLKAIWKAYTVFNIKVTLDGNEYTTTVREGEKLTIESLSIPAKEGYRVVLYDENNAEYNLENPVTSDLVLTGKYVEIKKFTVKFDANGGTKVNVIEVTEGETVKEPTTTRDGYVFAGWYLGNEKYDFTTPVTKSITLKARWNEADKVTVTFNVDGKTYKTVSVKENTKVSKPTNPTKKGYKFVEWQLDGKSFDFNTKITEEITLTAKFEETKSYTVKFDSNGGSSVKQQEVAVGGKVTKPDAPTRAGYKFVEWQLNGKAYDFTKEVIEDITLKAKWQEAKYTVTFDSNGGSGVASQTVAEGGKVTKPSNPTKAGYTFEEWLYNNQTFDFTTPIIMNITLTARYKLNKYTVTFNSNGGSSVASQEVMGNSAVVKPTNPVRDGYVFVEWQLNGKTYNFNDKVTSNIELKATWKEITYTYKLTPVDDYSPDRTITVYENGNKINFTSIKVNGVQICTGTNPTVNPNEITGNSVTVILINGKTVTAKLGS